VPTSAQWDSYFVDTAGETMFDKLVTMASTPFKPEQATSPLAPINIGSLSWI
jgi:hypothetical protein